MTEEISAGQEQVVAKTEKLATTDGKNSACGKDVADTTVMLREDT